MQYDSLGFPIPAEFEPIVDQEGTGWTRPAAPRRGPRPPSAGKRLFLALLVGVVIGPLLVGPLVLPVIREVVVEWSLRRAIAHEGRGNPGWAAKDLSRAIDWLGNAQPDLPRRSSLLCWRAMLRIEDYSPELGLADADQAALVTPTAVQPQRVRALALFVLRNFDQALAAAETAVELAGDGDPEALNHRAYFRALVGRDLDAALVDINRALEGSGEGSPEFLDTRGYVLHLLGRHQEAIDDLNIAIAATQKDRRQFLLLAGHIDDDEFAYRLRAIDHGLAVMLHHRGIACRSLGLAGQAEQDLAIAKQKGFDPSRGVL